MIPKIFVTKNLWYEKCLIIRIFVPKIFYFKTFDTKDFDQNLWYEESIVPTIVLLTMFAVRNIQNQKSFVPKSLIASSFCYRHSLLLTFFTINIWFQNFLLSTTFSIENLWRKESLVFIIFAFNVVCYQKSFFQNLCQQVSLLPRNSVTKILLYLQTLVPKIFAVENVLY